MEPQHEERRLTTILAADVVGYSRLMAIDEAGTFARLKAHRKELIEPKTAEYHGRVVKLTGDGTLMEFGSVVDAVLFAVDVQRAMAERDAAIPEERRIRYRVGINIGDIIVDGEDIYGDGVNVAARLEGLAEPGGICIARNVFSQVKNKVDLGFEDLGEKQVKNIPDPVRVYRVDLSRTDTDSVSRGSDAGSVPLPDKPSIAVLPFDNMSGDPQQEYFADGIAEDIITTLSHTHWLFVVARNSSFTYKGRAVDVRRVSEELRVRYVLEGSVRKAGNRVRISVQLIDATTSNHIWAERYDRDLEDIFAVQDEITGSVVAAIGPELMVAETRRAQRKPPQNLDAWDYVLRALPHIWRLNEEDNRKAQELLRRAIELDPEYAHAYSMLGWSYIFHAWNAYGENPADFIPMAREAARKAVELDERDPWGHVVLGRVYAHARDHYRAVAELEKAIELNPNLPIARGMLGLILAYGGRSDEALVELDKAIRANPQDPFNIFYYGAYSVAHYLAGRYEEAVRWARQAVRQRPDYVGAYRMLASSCANLGELEEAHTALDMAKRLQPGLSLAWVEEYAPYVRPDDLRHYIEGLRKAGLAK